MEIKLYKHQQKLVDKEPKKWLLSWGTGSGKTLTTIKLSELYGIHNVLVICPKSIKEKWQRDVEVFAKEPWLFTIVTKEEFKKRWENLVGFRKVIIDESHYFSGIKSSMYKTMIKWLAKNRPSQIYLATATPYLSTVWNIFALGNILGRDWKWHKWNKYFFYQIQMGNRKIPKQKEHINGVPIKDVVAETINTKLGNTVKLEDCVDVPDQTFLVEEFELTKDQERGIDELDDVAHIVYWTKCHQINGGTLKSDGYNEDQYFKCEKLNRVIDLCKEHKKIIIVSRYNNEIKYIQDVLKRNKKKVFIINGETKNKDTVCLQAELEEECVVLVNAACSEGYELPSFPIMVFYSYDFSLKNYIQMIGRIQRINNIKKNVYISLINKGTIDEDVYNSIQSKKDFDISIYNYNKN